MELVPEIVNPCSTSGVLETPESSVWFRGEKREREGRENRGLFIIQPTSFGCFPSIGLRNVFPMLCHCLPAVRGEAPLRIIPSLIGGKSIRGTWLARGTAVP